MRLAVDTMASSDPSTAARNHLVRPLWCFSPWGRELRLALPPNLNSWLCASVHLRCVKHCQLLQDLIPGVLVHGPS